MKAFLIVASVTVVLLLVAPGKVRTQVSNTPEPMDGIGHGVVTFIDASGRIEMKIDPSEFNAGMGNPLGSSTIKSVFRGKNSRLRTTNATPAFEASAPKNVYAYNHIGLLLLTAKSDRREIETGKVAAFGSDRSGFRKTDIMPIAITEISEQATTASLHKRYSVRTAKVLEPGEYALLVGGAYYTFGIDPVPAAVLSDARIKWAAAPKLLVGSWRGESSVRTFNVDGTLTSTSNGGKGTWSIDGDFLTTTWIESGGKRLTVPDTWRLQIIELTNEKAVLKDPTGKTWHSVRVVQ